MLKRLKPLLLILVFMLSLSLSQAQTPLNYGDTFTGSLDAGTPQGFLTFNGSAGDVVSIYVLGHGDMQPTVTLFGSQGQLAFSNGNSFTPFAGDASITYRLPATGAYSVLVSSATGVFGDYTATIRLEQPLISTQLTGDSTLNIPQGAPVQSLTIPANPNNATPLTIASGQPDFAIAVELRDSTGQVLAVIRRGVSQVTLVIPASTEPHELLVTAADPETTGSISISLSGNVAQPSDSSSSAPPPATTEDTQAEPPQGDPNACNITASNVNVRSGPGTDFNTIGSLQADVNYVATGQNSGWYYIGFNGGNGWVFSGVVQASGNACPALPFVNAPSAPQPQPPASTEEVQPPIQATPTSQPVATTESSPPTTAAPTEVPPTEVPFEVVSLSCRYFQNEGATVDFRVNGPPGGTFRIDVRQGSTVYSATRTMNQQGFLTGNQRFGQAGNSNYVAYIVYNNVDIDDADC